jgi:hypothetical protein
VTFELDYGDRPCFPRSDLHIAPMLRDSRFLLVFGL